MEITSFILGVFAVISIGMVVITSMNYMALKTLKQDFDDYKRGIENVLKDIYADNEDSQQELHLRITETEQALIRHIDSRVDKLANTTSTDINKLYSEVDKILGNLN
jgi:F0F1-type ATP synthase membrane subunit b/b'